MSRPPAARISKRLRARKPTTSVFGAPPRCASCQCCAESRHDNVVPSCDREALQPSLINVGDGRLLGFGDRFLPEQVRSLVHREAQIAGEDAQRQAVKGHALHAFRCWLSCSCSVVAHSSAGDFGFRARQICSVAPAWNHQRGVPEGIPFADLFLFGCVQIEFLQAGCAAGLEMRRRPVVTWKSGLKFLPRTIQLPVPWRAASSATTGWLLRSANCARSCCPPSPCQVKVRALAVVSLLARPLPCSPEDCNAAIARLRCRATSPTTTAVHRPSFALPFAIPTTLEHSDAKMRSDF